MEVQGKVRTVYRQRWIYLELIDSSAGLREQASYTFSRAFVIVVYVVAGRWLPDGRRERERTASWMGTVNNWPVLIWRRLANSVAFVAVVGSAAEIWSVRTTNGTRAQTERRAILDACDELSMNCTQAARRATDQMTTDKPARERPAGTFYQRTVPTEQRSSQCTNARMHLDRLVSSEPRTVAYCLRRVTPIATKRDWTYHIYYLKYQTQIHFIVNSRKWYTRKRGNCEYIATWRRPTPRQSFPALVTTPCQVWSRWTYPLPYYSVFSADTLLYAVTLTFDLWPWTFAVYHLWRYETLYHIWMQSSNPQRSYCDFSVWPYDLEHVLRVVLSSGIIFNMFDFR